MDIKYDDLYNTSKEYVYGLVEEICRKLISLNKTVSTAESCTGGMLAAKIVDFPGASNTFMGGFVTYTNDCKQKYVNVSGETLSNYGAVSPQTAEEMCKGARIALNTDIGLSTTGVAGPAGGTPEKPVGLVYIGVSTADDVKIKKLMLKGSRNDVRKQTVTAVLELLRLAVSD